MKSKKILANAFKAFLLVAVAGSVLILASCKTSPRTVKGRAGVADLDPIETAVITAQFPNFLGTALESRQLSVSFVPRTDEALLQFRMHGNVYMLYLHRKARALVREAAVQYNEDFDAARLDRGMSRRRSERLYGMAEGCYMEWDFGSFAMNGEASPRISAGYLFEDRSPYFTITVYSADNPRYDSSGNNIEKSVTYAIYMNKAQSLVLADALSEAALLSALNTVTVPIFNPDEHDQDVKAATMARTHTAI